MGQVNVRLDEDTREVLRRLALQEGRSMQAVLAAAVEEYRRRKILEAANAGYAELRVDAAEWKVVLAERARWDDAVADGMPSPERFRGPVATAVAAAPARKRATPARGSRTGGTTRATKARTR